MSESWRQYIDLSIELERIDARSRDRQRPAAETRIARSRSQLPAPMQAAKVVARGHLQRLLEIIPDPHQPSAYPPELVRPVPARRFEHAVPVYVPDIMEIEAAPSVWEARPRLVEAKPLRDGNGWRSIAVAFFTGAVLGVGGFVSLSQWPSGRGETTTPRTPPKGGATEIVRGPSPLPAVAAPKWTYAQLHPGDPNAAPADLAAPMQSSNKVGLQKPAVLAQPEAPSSAAVDQPAARMADDILIERATGLLRQGSVSDARAIYATMAQRGSPKGAFHLAETYDPSFCARYSDIKGLKADLALARSWYRKALQLGSLEASQRLKELPKTTSSASEVLRR